MKTLFIVNPAAGHGRAGARWARTRALATAARPDHAVWETARPGDGATLARRGLEAGFTTLVAVGGDGTLGEVLDGFLQAAPALRAGAALTTWPAGSGCDGARQLGIRHDPEAFAALLARPTVRRLDVGRVTCPDAAGANQTRHFFSMVAVGLATEVAQAIQARGKALGGTLSYLVEALRTVARATPRPLRLTVDGAAAPPTPYHLVVVANTRHFGGGMQVAPAADPADGILDLVTVGAVSRGALLGLLAAAYRGAHVGRPGVTIRRVRRVEATGEGRWPLNVDGEVWGSLPASIEVLSGALPVLMPDAPAYHGR